MKDYKKWHLTYWGTCGGTTKEGKPCGATSVYGNGRCRHHGGFTSQAEIDEYLAKVRAQAKRASERFIRKHPGLAPFMEEAARIRRNRRNKTS